MPVQGRNRETFEGVFTKSTSSAAVVRAEQLPSSPTVSKNRIFFISVGVNGILFEVGIQVYFQLRNRQPYLIVPPIILQQVDADDHIVGTSLRRQFLDRLRDLAETDQVDLALRLITEFAAALLEQFLDEIRR